MKAYGFLKKGHMLFLSVKRPRYFGLLGVPGKNITEVKDYAT